MKKLLSNRAWWIIMTFMIILFAGIAYLASRPCVNSNTEKELNWGDEYTVIAPNELWLSCNAKFQRSGKDLYLWCPDGRGGRVQFSSNGNITQIDILRGENETPSESYTGGCWCTTGYRLLVCVHYNGEDYFIPIEVINTYGS